MGATQSLVSAEALLTAAVVAGAVGLGYTKIAANSPGADTAAPSGTASATTTSTGAKKGKKKKQASAQSNTPTPRAADPALASEPTVPSVAQFPAVIPGQFDTTAASAGEEAPPASKSKKSKKKAKSTVVPPTTTSSADKSDSSVGQPKPKPKRQQKSPSSSSSSQLTKPLHQSTISIDTDGSWTRVEPRRRPAEGSASEARFGPSTEVTTSDAGTTTSVTSSPIAERTEDDGDLVSNPRNSNSGDSRRPLAEKLLPKPRKTGVADMLETPDYPSLSRVMRIQPQPDEKPASGFSWGDYEDVDATKKATEGTDGEDDGWGVVKSKSRAKIDRSPGSSSQAPTASKAPETLTKRQRQNANKRDEQKALKAAAEAERLATLATHKRGLERVKMIEQLSAKGGGKSPSGGMTATVDERGKLVWE